jgi:hypothetical protein
MTGSQSLRQYPTRQVRAIADIPFSVLSFAAPGISVSKAQPARSQQNPETNYVAVPWPICQAARFSARSSLAFLRADCWD